MNRNKITGTILIISGCILSLIGITLLFAKGTSMVPIISVPVLFFGILIWYHGEKDSPVKAEELRDL